MAKLKLRLKSLDGVPEAVKSFYRQMEDGGFVIDADDDPEGYGIDRLPVIRGKLAEKEKDLERLNSRLQRFAKADGSLLNPDEIQAAIERAANLATEVETLKSKTKTDEQKLADMVASAKRPLEAELAKVKATQDAYRQRVISAEKARLIAKAKQHAKPIREWEDAIDEAIARRIEIREREDGEFEHVIMEDGKPRMSSLMGRDGAMDVEEYVKSTEFRTKYGRYLEGDGKKGADIGGTSDRAATQNRGSADVVLPPSYTQQQFEQAFQQASKAGGQVVFSSQGGQQQS